MTLLERHLQRRCEEILLDVAALEEYPTSPSGQTAWLKAWSRVNCDAQNVWADLRIASIKDTENQEVKRNTEWLHREFVDQFDHIDSKLAVFANQSINSGVSPRYRKIWSAIAQDIALIPPPSSKITALIADYERLLTEIRVVYRDNVLTKHEANLLFENTQDNKARKDIWLAIKEAELAQSEVFDHIFLELYSLKHETAHLNGFSNYASYFWSVNFRELSLETSLEMCQQLHEFIIGACNTVGYFDLNSYPWEKLETVPNIMYSLLIADPLVIALDTIRSINNHWHDITNFLINNNWIDLKQRKGKLNVNTSVHLIGTERFEVICSVSPNLTGLRAIFHELGHVFHNHATTNSEGFHFWDYVGFSESQEFFAHAIEYICLFEYMHKHAPSRAAATAFYKVFAEQIVQKLVDVQDRANFEFWIFSLNDKPSINDLDNFYYKNGLPTRHNWAEFGQYLKKMWQKPHSFRHEFYSLDYTIAIISALQFLESYLDDRESALQRLLAAMQMGGHHDLPDVLKTAGVEFPFTPSTLSKVNDFLRKVHAQEESI